MAKGFNGARRYSGSGRNSSERSLSGVRGSSYGATSRGSSTGRATASGSAAARVNASSAQRSTNTRAWSQPATSKQIAALRAHGNYDGKYYSKGRAGQAIGASIRGAGSAGGSRGIPADMPARRSRTTPLKFDADEAMSALVEDLRNTPEPVPNAPVIEGSWGTVLRQHTTDELEHEMNEMITTPLQGPSMSVFTGMRPFAFLSELEDRNVRRIERTFGLHSPDEVRREIASWNEVKVAVATTWMNAHADIEAILRAVRVARLPMSRVQPTCC